MDEEVKTEITEVKQKIDRRKTMPHLFKKGQSGNPGGRAKKSPELRRIEDMAKEHSDAALLALVDEARNGKGAPRVAASIALLDRAWGRPVDRQESGAPGSFAAELTDEQLDADIKETVELAIKSGTAKALKIVKAA